MPLVVSKPRLWAWAGAISLGGFILFLVALLILNHNSMIYPLDDAGLSHVHGDQCERPKNQAAIVELMNTLSNVGYMLAGVLVLLRGSSWAARILGANLVLLSIMSGIYHATLNDIPQKLDVAWVYAVLLALSTYMSFVQVRTVRPYRLDFSLWRVRIATAVFVVVAFFICYIFSPRATGLIALFVLSWVVVVINMLCFLQRRYASWLEWPNFAFIEVLLPCLGYTIKIKWHWDSDAVFAVLIWILLLQLVYVLMTEPKPLDRSQLGWDLGLIGGILVAGVVVRLLDGYTDSAERKPLCLPDSIFQAHALWHMLGAAALLLGYELLTQLQREPLDKPAIHSDGANLTISR